MEDSLQDQKHWALVVDQWTAWARAHQHDAFWAYRQKLRSYLGQGPAKALEVGCGEGRVSRELRDLGYHVTATDAVSEFVAVAQSADSADEYAVADAKELPFEANSFDLVMAYNVLMDVQDVPAALREMGRVLRPNGQLFISIVHPFRDRGRFTSLEPDAPFELEGSYFGRQRFDGIEERAGLRMHFAGWSQPLEMYMMALEEAGFVIASLREPTPDAIGPQEHLKQWERVPLFLWLKARLFCDTRI